MSKVAKVVQATPSETEAQFAAVDPLISMIERAARDPAVDLDKMQRLFDMHQAMQERRSKGEYYAAMSAMQAELPAAVRRGTGHNNKKYARFEDVIEALKPNLKAHGFSLTYRIKQTSDRIIVSGVLGHSSGHTEETEISLPADTSGGKNTVQAWASSVSYGKRYVALTLTGIATDDDDDGQAAGGDNAITEDQELKLRDMMEATGADVAAFCKYFKVAKLADLPAKDFNRAMQALEKKAAQQ